MVPTGAVASNWHATGLGAFAWRDPLTATHSPLRQVDRALARAKPSAGATGVRRGGRPTKPQCAQAAGAQAFASQTAGLGPRIAVVWRPAGRGRGAKKGLPAKVGAWGRESSLSEGRRVKWPWGCVVRRQLIESIAAAKARGHCAGHAAIAPRTLCAPWFGKGQ